MLLKKSTDFETLRITKPAGLEFKAQADGHVVGYAAVFDDGPDAHYDVIKQGAFSKSLTRHQGQGSRPSMLWMHDLAKPIGKWTAVSEDSRGLHVEGVVNLKTDEGKQAFSYIEAGDADGLSIGYRVPKGGSEFKHDGTRHLKEIDLWEISVVTVPAQQSARILSVKSLSSKAELIEVLREVGLSKMAAARIAAGGWQALSGPDHQKANDLVAAIEGATLNLKDF